MKKLGRKGMIKNWKKRFFVLNAGVITYYEKEINEFPFGDSLKVYYFVRIAVHLVLYLIVILFFRVN